MLNKIRQNFQKYQALFISNPVNIYYLTGFTGSRGMILITPKKAYFFTDFRYIEYAKKIIPKEFNIIQINKKWKTDWPKLLKKYRIKSLGIEENYITYQQFLDLRKISKGVHLKKSGLVIEQLRQFKSESELIYLKKSQKINEELLRKTLKFIKIGRTEKEVEWFILNNLSSVGAQGVSFTPIIAFGSNSSIPHHQNGNKKLKNGDTILIDMGVKYKGYCSDMSRSFFTKKPTVLQKNVYQTVLDAQNMAIQKLKNGVYVNEVTNVAMNIIEKAGYKKNFQHALGHGTGLEIHELPNLGAKDKTKLFENMITTIEPGIYLPKNFGIRIEDMLIITRTGYTNTTKFPKDLKNSVLAL
ncbi:aminopeptidase P family protein [bacterium]|nr:aminopeptidase P family protein [bacterium]